MSVDEFYFALELFDEPRFDNMINELTAVVLKHAGYAPPEVGELQKTLRTALAAEVARGGRRCDVRFRAGAGEMQILVDFAGGGRWQTTRPLP